MLKRLWLILGPVLCAFLMVIAILLFYPIRYSHHAEQEKKLAVTLTSGTFKSKTKKTEAFSDKSQNYVPFFGSSEWLRFDSMHPAVLAEKYNRTYRPYFLGERGTSSLNQFFGMQQMLPAIQNKSVVYVISPQWFTAKGYKLAAFQQYFNSGQLASFLENQNGDLPSKYAAQRLLALNPTVTMKDILEKISDGESLTDFDKSYISFRSQISQREDNFFSDFIVKPNQNYEKLVKPQLERLPDDFSYEKLTKIAINDAKKQTTSNEFGINDVFYFKKINHRLAKLKNSQYKFSYLKSAEYTDLQLVLNQFAKSKTNVMFVIPPVNQKWADYTGLNMSDYQATVSKIRYQLESQGFNHIADFSNQGTTPYFMEDTIHLGWVGWLAFDKAINPFLSNPTRAPEYKINNAFLTKSWAKYTGDYKQFSP